MGPEDELLHMAGIAAPEQGGGKWWDITIPLPLKKSSAIASATYGLATGELNLSFQNGGAAAHKADIPTIIRFIGADSPGGFYNREIRGK